MCKATEPIYLTVVFLYSVKGHIALLGRRSVSKEGRSSTERPFLNDIRAVYVCVHMCECFGAGGMVNAFSSKSVSKR